MKQKRLLRLNRRQKQLLSYCMTYRHMQAR